MTQEAEGQVVCTQTLLATAEEQDPVGMGQDTPATPKQTSTTTLPAPNHCHTNTLTCRSFNPYSTCCPPLT